MIKYRHFREHNNGIFTTGRTALQHGGLTVAMTVEQDKCSFGFAKCSDKDKFCKKTGAQISRYRLDSTPLTLDIKEFRRYLLDIYSHKGRNSNDLLKSNVVNLIYSGLTFKDVNEEAIFRYFRSVVLKKTLPINFAIKQFSHYEKKVKVKNIFDDIKPKEK